MPDIKIKVIEKQQRSQGIVIVAELDFKGVLSTLFIPEEDFTRFAGWLLTWNHRENVHFEMDGKTLDALVKETEPIRKAIEYCFTIV